MEVSRSLATRTLYNTTLLKTLDKDDHYDFNSVSELPPINLSPRGTFHGQPPPIPPLTAFAPSTYTPAAVSDVDNLQLSGPLSASSRQRAGEGSGVVEDSKLKKSGTSPRKAHGGQTTEAGGHKGKKKSKREGRAGAMGREEGATKAKKGGHLTVIHTTKHVSTTIKASSSASRRDSLPPEENRHEKATGVNGQEYRAKSYGGVSEYYDAQSSRSPSMSTTRISAKKKPRSNSKKGKKSSQARRASKFDSFYNISDHESLDSKPETRSPPG